ncbi:MAG: TIGR02453 family protein [Gammaproteobacteria bacterium]|nr:TIGR02453 family protein [Gammaproteobacteria bacterium]
MAGYNGFPKDCIPFLKDLRAHNERDWFNENKGRYESTVREPALKFIEEMGPKLMKVSPHFRAIPKKVGGSLMRVYRDIRFSKDKTPFKTNIGIQFRHELGKDVHAPGFYLHIEPGDCFLGVGLWRPDSKQLIKIRDFIIDNPNAWQQALAYLPFKSNFELVGASLKRPPRGYPADHALLEDLKRKDFIALMPFDEVMIEYSMFVDFVVKHYRQADQFMHYLCDAVQVNYKIEPND